MSVKSSQWPYILHLNGLILTVRVISHNEAYFYWFFLTMRLIAPTYFSQWGLFPTLISHNEAYFPRLFLTMRLVIFTFRMIDLLLTYIWCTQVISYLWWWLHWCAMPWYEEDQQYMWRSNNHIMLRYSRQIWIRCYRQWINFGFSVA